MTKGVEAGRFVEYRARCTQCDRLRPDATRERARVHTADSGHVVHYERRVVTTYRRVA